ncbi:MAG TPA: YdeI/OmpD-associated family protein [Candidatus Paceibacterota bacterium]|nr:YdeI/OmpD-associated family protein [Candidatus Paceibacterota bacterium]
MTRRISSGVVHAVPADMRAAVLADGAVQEAWEDITPLARNEWICWVVSPKKPETRADHIRRMREDLKKGKRRPCCWAGCTHR